MAADARRAIRMPPAGRCFMKGAMPDRAAQDDSFPENSRLRSILHKNLQIPSRIRFSKPKTVYESGSIDT